jgi:hypothetical protein
MQFVSGLRMRQLMWAADGRSIFFPSNKDALPALFRVSASGGPVQRELIFPAR